MNLGELLDELRNNVLHDRSNQIAGDNSPSSYLWSDNTLIRYINVAERKMAREALMIRDARTPDCCELQTQPFEREYDLHDSVVAVISARCEHDHADLARAGHADFNTYHVPDTYFFDPSALGFLPPGKIVAYDTDEGIAQDDNGSFGRMTFRTFPAPDPIHVQTIKLRVCRMPLQKLCNMDDVPEVPEDHHIDMLSWAAYLALRIVDRDAGDPARAAEFKQDFEVHVAEARKVAMRKMFSRAQWGFGRNGFSWETNQ